MKFLAGIFLQLLIGWIAPGIVVAAIKPNFVFIMADDLSWRGVGYHSKDIPTPNINRLAQQGVKLEQHYTQPSCGPSRASFLTGKLPTSNGFYNNIPIGIPAALSLDHETIAETLSKAGYTNYMTGKWHLGFNRKKYLPTSRGFQEYIGVLGGSENHLNHKVCVKFPEAKRRLSCGIQLYRNEAGNPVVQEKYKGVHSTDLYGSKAVRFIRKHAAKKTNPMFLYVAFTAPHKPYQESDRYISKCRVTDFKRMLYCGMVARIDEWVGRIKDALVETGLWNNTILVFTSDNGGQVKEAGLNYPLRGGKATYFEGGIRTPTFATSPLIGSPGRVSNILMSIADWFPTFANIAGINIDGDNLDGVDQWDAISNNASGGRDELLLGMHINRTHGNDLNLPFDVRIKGAYRKGPWKLITGGSYGDKFLKRSGWKSPNPRIIPTRPSDFTKDQNVALYNIEEDPYETNDLQRSRPDILNMMCVEMESYRQRAVPVLVDRGRSRDPKSNPKLHNGVWIPWLEGK